jgi:hypothetical protein
MPVQYSLYAAPPGIAPLLTSNAVARIITRSAGLPGAYVLLLRKLQDC